ncbi:MAG: hypothetical protein AB1467_05935 [Candidatus Diapherotrites archaeon]
MSTPRARRAKQKSKLLPELSFNKTNRIFESSAELVDALLPELKKELKHKLIAGLTEKEVLKERRGKLKEPEYFYSKISSMPTPPLFSAIKKINLGIRNAEKEKRTAEKILWGKQTKGAISNKEAKRLMAKFNAEKNTIIEHLLLERFFFEGELAKRREALKQKRIYILPKAFSRTSSNK